MSLATSTPEMSLGATTKVQLRSSTTDSVDLFGLGLAVLVLIVAGISLVYLLVLAFNWYNAPFLGAIITDSLTVNGNDHPLTSANWNGFQAGLRDNDQIVGITSQDGQTLTFDPNT